MRPCRARPLPPALGEMPEPNLIRSSKEVSTGGFVAAGVRVNDLIVILLAVEQITDQHGLPPAQWTLPG